MNCPNCQIEYDPDRWRTCPHCGEEVAGQDSELELSGVLRTSTILIASGNDRSEIYRSVEDVPEPLRRMLVESTNGQNSGTIYIADQRGREQIARAIRNLPVTAPAPVFDRFSAALAPQSKRRVKAGVPLAGIWIVFLIAVTASGILWLVGGWTW